MMKMTINIIIIIMRSQDFSCVAALTGTLMFGVLRGGGVKPPPQKIFEFFNLEIAYSGVVFTSVIKILITFITSTCRLRVRYYVSWADQGLFQKRGQIPGQKAKSGFSEYRHRVKSGEGLCGLFPVWDSGETPENIRLEICTSVHFGKAGGIASSGDDGGTDKA